MTTEEMLIELESFIPRNKQPIYIQLQNLDNFRNLLKQYAHSMCEKQKEICADNAEADYQMITGTIVPDIEVYVLKQSILQCKNATEL